MKLSDFYLCLFLLFGLSLAENTLSHAPAYEKSKHEKKWQMEALNSLWKERNWTETPLICVGIPGMPYLNLTFKDETKSKTMSSQHRISWDLYVWAIVEGFVHSKTTIYEASNGNSAISEAYFAQIIGLNFVAVVPESTELSKVEKIREYGGEVRMVNHSMIFVEAARLADQNNGFFMNSLANSHYSTEFHTSGYSDYKSSNLMYEIISQSYNHTVPRYFVHSAGTGGTITSVGRYVHKYNLRTKVVLADSEFSIYYDYVINNRFSNESDRPQALWVNPGVAETGFGYSGPAVYGKTTSLVPGVIDITIKVPDLASVAAMHVLKELGINGGASTGLNLVASLSLAYKNKDRKIPDKLSVVTLVSDSSLMYEATYCNRTWIGSAFARHGGLPVFDCWLRVINKSITEGTDPLEVGKEECAHKLSTEEPQVTTSPPSSTTFDGIGDVSPSFSPSDVLSTESSLATNEPKQPAILPAAELALKLMKEIDNLNHLLAIEEGSASVNVSIMDDATTFSTTQGEYNSAATTHSVFATIEPQQSTTESPQNKIQKLEHELDSLKHLLRSDESPLSPSTSSVTFSDEIPTSPSVSDKNATSSELGVLISRNRKLEKEFSNLLNLLKTGQSSPTFVTSSAKPKKDPTAAPQFVSTTNEPSVDSIKIQKLEDENNRLKKLLSANGLQNF